jgi:hypothetical protein
VPFIFLPEIALKRNKKRSKIRKFCGNLANWQENVYNDKVKKWIAEDIGANAWFRRWEDVSGWR